MYIRIISVLSLVLFLSASASTESLQRGRRIYEFDSRSLVQMQNLVNQHNISLDNLIALNFPEAMEQDYKTLASFKSELAKVLYREHRVGFNYHVNDDFMLLSLAI